MRVGVLEGIDGHWPERESKKSNSFFHSFILQKEAPTNFQVEISVLESMNLEISDKILASL